MKKGLVYFTPEQMASFRMFVAGVVLFPLGLKMRPKITTKNAGLLFLAGMLGSFIPAFLFAYAQTNLDSALTGILNSFVPCFTVVFGLLFFKKQFKAIQYVGVLVGLLGVIGLIYSTATTHLHFNPFYAFLVLVATLCYAFNVNLLKSWLSDLNGREISSLSFLFLLPLSIVAVWQTGFFNALTPKSYWAAFYIALLGIGATAFAIIIFNDLLKATSALFGSIVTYMIPLVALFFGLLDGETIYGVQLLFAGVILIGVFLVSKR